MNPLAQALLTGLMLRFGFLSRAEIDAVWASMVERLGTDRAIAHVQGVIDTTLEALPEGCPNDLAGRAIAGAVKAIVAEWMPRVATLKEIEGGEFNPLLTHLIVSWRARTSDLLTDENEAEWWNLLVEAHGVAGASEQIERTMTHAASSTIRTESDDMKHAMAVGHEAVRALLRLVDETRAKLTPS